MTLHLFIYRGALYLTSLTSFILGCVIFFKAKRSWLTSMYLAFCFSLTCWSFLEAQMSVEMSPEKVLILGQIMHIFIFFIPCFFLHSVYLLIGAEKGYRKTLIPAYLICTLFTAFIPFKSFIGGVRYLKQINYMVYPGGLLYYFSCVFFYMLVGLSLYKLHQASKNSSGLRAKQLRYVFWSTLIGFTSGPSNFLYIYNKMIPGFNPYITFGVPLYVLMITYAIFKLRFMDINLVLRKTVIYGAIYSLCLGLFSFIVILLGRRAEHILNINNFALSMLGVLIIVLLVKPLDRLLTNLTDKFLFHKKYEYQKTLKAASLGMISIRKLDKLLNLIVTIITRHVRVKQAAIFLFDKNSGSYVVKASRGKHKIPKNFLKISLHNALIRYLTKTKDSVVCEELKIILTQNKDKALSGVIKEMESLNASVCVPSFLKGRLSGFLLLGEKLSGEIYTQEDLSLFATLSLQAGLAIENAQAYEELSAAKDHLFEIERFASIGRLAAGIAHEIKNPLASIKTFTEYLDKKFDDPAFRKNFQRIVGSEVDRINHIVEQLVTYVHPKHSISQNANPHRVIEQTLALIENDLRKERIKVERQFHDKSIELHADSKQLKQVFLNLFLNSIQAMQNNNGKLKQLKIATYKENGCFKIKISDSGEGIPQEKISMIFEPFFTTKEDGSGLGLTIVRSLIENHKGIINVESQPHIGTTFTISLPLK